MASGMSGAIIPTGQPFFGLRAKDRVLNEDPVVAAYLSLATEIAHVELYESNFMLHLNETLRSLNVFGTGNLYSEWDAKRGCLNFKDWAINLYTIKESSQGTVDTVILSFRFTARQAIQEFGELNVSQKVRDNAGDMKRESERFDFIQIIRPRTERNPLFADNKNMPFESASVEVGEKLIVREEGYEEMPYAVARWMKRANEKYGRGQGTEHLADIRMLNKMWKDFIDLGNRYANPPWEVLDSFEGQVDVRPNATNRVQQLNSIKGLDMTVIGNAPITKEMIDIAEGKVKDAFYWDVFSPITQLEGTHRTALEIELRRQEGLRRLASPMARLLSELFNPVITRGVLILIRNGRIPAPPRQLQGQQFGIEYTGPLALALGDQQTKAFMQWATLVEQVAVNDPSARDSVAYDRAIPRAGRRMGVNIGDMATPEEIAAKREARAKQQAAQEMMQAAETAGKAYKSATTAPEPGSPAEELVGAK
jgi:hypothetical protein